MSTKRDVQIKGHQRLVRIVVGGIYGREILVFSQFVKIVCGGITGVTWHRDVIFIEQSLIHLFNSLVFFAVWVLLSPCSTTMLGSVGALCSTRCLAQGNRVFPTTTDWRTHRNCLYNVWLQIYNNVITCKILYYEDISPSPCTDIRVHPCLFLALWFYRKLIVKNVNCVLKK